MNPNNQLTYQWLPFQIHLPSLEKHLKETLTGFTGLFAGETLGLSFDRQVLPTDSQLVDDYLTSLTEEGELLKFTSSVDFNQLVTNARSFGDQLLTQFASENVSMGITQLGLTSDVLSVMESRVECEPLTKAGVTISLISTIQSGSLYEAVKVIDYHIAKANEGVYDQLAPFLTPERLGNFKQKILDYLN